MHENIVWISGYIVFMIQCILNMHFHTKFIVWKFITVYFKHAFPKNICEVLMKKLCYPEVHYLIVRKKERKK